MSYNYSADFYPEVGDVVKVERLGMPEITVSINNVLSTLNVIGSDDDIPLIFFAEITKVSETGNIEEIKITQPPEFVKFENKLSQEKFNEQFTIGKLINANQFVSQKFECSFCKRG